MDKDEDVEMEDAGMNDDDEVEYAYSSGADDGGDDGDEVEMKPKLGGVRRFPRCHAARERSMN